MSNIHSLIKSAKLSSSDKKQIADVVAEYRELDAIQNACEFPKGFGETRFELTTAIEAARDALVDNPSRAAAEVLHRAIIRREEAKQTEGAIAGALHHARLRTSAKLKPLALRIVAEAEASAKETAASQRAAMVAGGVDQAVLATHDSKLAETLRNIEGERGGAESHALDFVIRHNLDA